MKFVPNSIKTAEFYNELVKGHKSRRWLGIKNRYEVRAGAQEYFIKKYFFDVVSRYINSETRVLDFGCGPGIFSNSLVSLTPHVTGVDISEEFINLAKKNCTKELDFFVVDSDLKNLIDHTFDVVICVDVLHHLENTKKTIEKVAKKLKPGGIFLIFEPNILSIPIFLMHILDPNERGLLPLGRKNKYIPIFSDIARLEHFEFNGIVIGPANIFFKWISNLINLQFSSPILKTFNPKIFLVFRKQED